MLWLKICHEKRGSDSCLSHSLSVSLGRACSESGCWRKLQAQMDKGVAHRVVMHMYSCMSSPLPVSLPLKHLLYAKPCSGWCGEYQVCETWVLSPQSETTDPQLPTIEYNPRECCLHGMSSRSPDQVFYIPWRHCWNVNKRTIHPDSEMTEFSENIILEETCFITKHLSLCLW